jgi:Tripartite tricarboxylate transporter family receptor
LRQEILQGFSNDHRETHMDFYKIIPRIFSLLVFIAVLLGGVGAGNAIEYPTQVVKIVVGFPPGGSADTVARLVADKLSKQLGQPVIIENRAGAGGAIAAEQVARARPDGHTLLLVPSGHSSAAAMRKSMPFDPVADFEWISLVTSYPLVFAVRKESPLTSFAEIIGPRRLAAGGGHRCRCPGFAVVLWRRGQAGCRPLGSAARFNSIIAAGKSTSSRAARSIYR